MASSTSPVSSDILRPLALSSAVTGNTTQNVVLHHADASKSDEGKPSLSNIFGSPVADQAARSEGSVPIRRGRKGHSKSRTGCYNCKRARIKCKENHPSCEYCSNRGLQCEWPGIQNQVNRAGTLIHKERSPPILASMQAQIPVFNVQDFRLFNHFIETAYPHHPPLNDSVWTHEIPSIASDYDFLLHSMLALSASDLAVAQPANPELDCTAMYHRVKAIRSLNEALGKPLDSIAQGNAMIATCFSLLFQSTLINDGLVEYMTFIRGVLVVSIQMAKNNLKFLFENLFNQGEVVGSELNESPLVDAERASDACRSLEQLFHLVKNPREVEFYGHLLSTARCLFTSSKDAYANLAKIYALFSYHMSHAEFAAFISPLNEAGKLLQSHFAALQLTMTPFTRRQTVGRRNSTAPGRNDGTTSRWLVALHRDIKPEMRKYYDWPIWVQSEVAAGRLRLRWNEDPAS